jgi:hypothetical protein
MPYHAMDVTQVVFEADADASAWVGNSNTTKLILIQYFNHVVVEHCDYPAWILLLQPKVQTCIQITTSTVLVLHGKLNARNSIPKLVLFEVNTQHNRIGGSHNCFYCWNAYHDRLGRKSID